MIEMMNEYTDKLQERLNEKDPNNEMTFEQDNVARNFGTARNDSSSASLADFSDCKMAVMTMCVHSATAKSGSECIRLADVVRKAATTSLVGEVVLVEEAWNSIVVAVGPNTSQSTGTPVAQLLALAGQVVNTVRTEISNNNNSLIYSAQLNSTQHATHTGGYKGK